ncbi:MAG: calcium/proton exchanger [Deinococcales bacterium]
MLNWLLILVPVAFILEFLVHPGDTWIFIVSALAILPLAGLMGKATEELAARAGATVGGLLNATFGNATELIIAFFALSAGKFDVVKASITGSIIGNLLLVLGLALFLGGLKYPKQTFNRNTASTAASLLVISIIAFLVPALFDLTEKQFGISSAQVKIDDANLALGVALVLLALYAANIIFTLVTHKDLLSTADEATEEHHKTEWSVPVALGVLLGSTVMVGFMSEFLVSSLEGFTKTLNLSEFFVGLIIIPIVGNAAEHASAIVFAMKNRMELAVTIAVGSTIQVALLVAPLLVLLSWLIGKPMDLVLNNPLEIVTLIGAVLIGNSVTKDGETNWLEGFMLLGVYVILALAFFFLPNAPGIAGHG